MKHIINFLKQIILFIIGFFFCLNVDDRTYSSNVGLGIPKKRKVARTASYSQKPGYVRQPALISFRWTTHRGWRDYGGEVVLTKQQNTTRESLELALKLKEKMNQELLNENRFVGERELYLDWIQKQAIVLEKNGFQNIKKRLVLHN